MTRPTTPIRSAFPDGGLRPTDVVGAHFLAGLTMMVGGAVFAFANALEPWQWGRWMTLHLVFVGGVSQLVLGASQFFAGAFLATDPPSRALVRAQLALWNLGVILLVCSVPAGVDAVVWLAVACLSACLLLYLIGFGQMRRRSLGRVPWASRWYMTAAGFLGVGVVAGAALATGVPWSHGNLIAAHVALNLGGWFGTAIVGTLHTFFPSLTQSRLRFPRLQAPTFGAWAAGVAGLATGYAFSFGALAAAGWLLLLAASVMLAANLIGSLIAAERVLTLAARMVSVGQVLLVAGLLVAAGQALAGGADAAMSGASRASVGTLLVAGWIGATVVGSLLHLLPLLLRARDFSQGMPEPRPRIDSGLAALALVAVGWVAIEQLVDAGDVGRPASAALLVVYLVLGGKVVRLGARVAASARPGL